MCFIQNHRRIVRQNRTVSAVAQREVSEEQVMIYHDDVRIDRPLTHTRRKARLEVRTLLAQASIRTGVDMPPERKILRKIRQLCTIARIRLSNPTKNCIKVIDWTETVEPRH